MDSKNGTVRVGPAGWNYDDWRGIIYPKRMPGAMHALTYLAQFFDTVEINVSFYRAVPCEHCVSWLRKVSANPRFKFTAKLWQRFTHERAVLPTPEEVQLVHDGLRPLHEAGRLGPLLLQFPWSYRNTEENRQWLSRLLDWFAAYPCAVEVRHASWDVPECYTDLARRNVAFCNIDQPLFHDSIAPMQHVTAPLGYVRLHGRNYTDWFREEAGRDDRYDYLYTTEELKPWLERIEKIRQQADEIYVITNNHYRGQAVVNAFDIMAAMGNKEFLIPPHMIEAFPRLRDYQSTPPPPEPQQGTLF